MNSRLLVAAFAMTGALALLACSDRTASTEVENELTTGVVVSSAEDTAPLPHARWRLLDGASIVDSGTTDSTGAFSATFRSSSRLLALHVEAHGDTVLALFSDSVSRDTLLVGVNLVTDAVARHWNANRDVTSFQAFSDSLTRIIFGGSARYDDLARPSADRSDSAAQALQNLNNRIRRQEDGLHGYLDSLLGPSAPRDSSR